jgi:hypothetical protein
LNADVRIARADTNSYFDRIASHIGFYARISRGGLEFDSGKVRILDRIVGDGYGNSVGRRRDGENSDAKPIVFP